MALRLRITGALPTLAEAQERLAEHLASVPARQAARAAVLLEEVAVNALRHGAASGVDVLAEASGDGCRLVFEDDGVAFDPTAARPAPPAHDLAHAQSGGRGLLLLHRIATALTYERVAGRNRLEVTLAGP